MHFLCVAKQCPSWARTICDGCVRSCSSFFFISDVDQMCASGENSRCEIVPVCIREAGKGVKELHHGALRARSLFLSVGAARGCMVPRGKNHDANDCDLIFTRFSHSTLYGVHPFIIQSLLQRLFLLRAGVSCHIENVGRSAAACIFFNWLTFHLLWLLCHNA